MDFLEYLAEELSKTDDDEIEIGFKEDDCIDVILRGNLS